MLKHACLASLIALATASPLANAQNESSPHDIAVDVVLDTPKPEMIDVTFLGVTATEVSPAMNSQLKLPKGLGLVVTHVAPDSPAQQAGLLKHDVLHKIDDQLIVNFDQFTTLIRMHEPGDTVTFSIIRQGEPTTLTATLTQQSVPDFSRLYKGNDPIWGQQGYFVPNPVPVPNLPRMEIKEVVPGGALQIAPGGVLRFSEAHAVHAKDRYLLRIVDGNHKVFINKLTDAGPLIKVEDAEGNVLYDGPWDPDTAPQTSGLPEDVIKQIDNALSFSSFGESIRIQGDEIEITPAPAHEE